MTPKKADLVDAIAAAARKAVVSMFAGYPKDHFYYCSLITTGEAHAPNLCAWSYEKLNELSAGDPEARRELKWSYADSPFYCYGEEYFDLVRRLFDQRPGMDASSSEQWLAEYTTRVDAMVEAMQRLDSEGTFGVGAQRGAIVINVEVMPPDRSNVERALRLNPRDALRDWLLEAAEP